jgi:hypothetical protein
MNFRGEAIGGSSIITLLAVLCLATVVVAATATILLSNTVTVTRTAHGSVTVGALGTFSDPGEYGIVDLPASDPLTNTMYDFSVPITGTSNESANIVFVFSGTGITGAGSVLLNVWEGGFTGLSGTYSAGDHTVTFNIPITLSSSQVDYGFYLKYMNEGTFTMDISVYSA